MNQDTRLDNRIIDLRVSAIYYSPTIDFVFLSVLVRKFKQKTTTTA